MKRLALWAFLLVLAAPLAAQSGDCLLETGTSTTWQILSGGTVRYTYYAAGLTGVTSTVFGGVGSTAEAADAFCDNADDSRVADELLRATILTRNNPTAELVTPAYPEICLAPPIVPNNPVATPAQNCRKARFHQALIRSAWPSDAQELRAAFWDVWKWVDRTGPQGPGFNTGNKQAWLAVTSTEWSNAVNQRMNNLAAFVSAFDQDRQWSGDLDRFR